WWSGRTARPRALPRGIPAGERQRQRAGQAVHSPAREVENNGRQCRGRASWRGLKKTRKDEAYPGPDRELHGSAGHHQIAPEP
ncbi:unnamed protein product, partial [Ascophyllum nodosum]